MRNNLKKGSVCRFILSSDPDGCYERGYIINDSPEGSFIEVIGESLEIDGYSFIKKDIILRRDTKFPGLSLILKSDKVGISSRKKQKVEISSIYDAIEYRAGKFCSFEKINKNGCTSFYIGRIRSDIFEGDCFYFDPVDDCGCWSKLMKVKKNEVVRVSWGGVYERTIIKVAGESEPSGVSDECH